MELELTLTPASLPKDALAEVTLALTFRHGGLLSKSLYVDQAQLAPASGWAGPWWDVLLLQDGVERPERLREVRTWYGPPGMLPTDEAFKPVKLERGKPLRRELRACWVPAARLAPEHVSVETLDPEGMDGFSSLGFELRGAGVLALGRTRADVEQAMRARKDFLRPGKVLFLPAQGRCALRVGYRPGARGSDSARSNEVELST